MFQYEFEKRPTSTGSCDSRVTMTTDWSRSYSKDRNYSTEGPSFPTAVVTHSSADRTHLSTGRPHPIENRSFPSKDTSYFATGRSHPGERMFYPPTGLSRPSEEMSRPIEGRSHPSEERSYPTEGRSYPSEERSYLTEGRSHPSRATRVIASVEKARRPLPPRPIDETLPTKTTVPLKVWIVAGASCLAVCAALVLATVVVVKWGTAEPYTRHQVFELPEPVYSAPSLPAKSKVLSPTLKSTKQDVSVTSDELETDLQFPIVEKLSLFRNVVASRDKNKRFDNKKPDGNNLISKPQIQPIHDASLYHADKRIEKKDQAVYSINYPINIENNNPSKTPIPNFKPILPDIVLTRNDMKTIGLTGTKKIDIDYEEYYNDENLYDDYMESNTMTSYLIEKVQELHDWIATDPDFNVSNGANKESTGNEFGTLLKALNETLIEGNVTIIMNKLKDIYFGENYTHANHSRKVLLSNGTDLLSFGILTLDVMLLHNIQLMAWENQESARTKMLNDPDVFAFNALFLEPGKVEATYNQIGVHHDAVAQNPKRAYLRPDATDEIDIGKALLENILEAGMSTARAAIHLGRAYKNTKNVLAQLSNRENLNTNIQNQISRNIDANSHALEHLQTSFSVGNVTGGYTELDCIWLLYCKNLGATAKLNAPYGTMARINGMALRMLTGELSTDHALDTMLYEALTGWTDLRCTDMFPRDVLSVKEPGLKLMYLLVDKTISNLP